MTTRSLVQVWPDPKEKRSLFVGFPTPGDPEFARPAMHGGTLVITIDTGTDGKAAAWWRQLAVKAEEIARWYDAAGGAR